MSYLLLLLGLGFLILGGDFLVRGAVGAALKLQVSTLVIGLTVVAFATSAPELLVSLQASLNGHPDIALGNVVGSNIANIGLIMGFSAMIYVLPVNKRDYRLDWIFMVAITLLFYILLASNGKLGFISGAVLTVLLLGYNFYKINESRRATKKDVSSEIDFDAKADPIWKMLLFLLLGILGLRYGADFFVEGASGIASQFGVSERVISVTVVAFGTSVPELVASIAAARKGEKDMAIGNLIGSNIFNVLAVLGVTSLITPIHVQDRALLTYDYWWMLGFSVVIFPMMGVITKGKLGRMEGLILFLLYIVYFALNIAKI